METNDKTPMAIFSSQRWLSDSIQLNTSTLENQTHSIKKHRTIGYQRSSIEIFSGRHHQDSSIAEHRFPFKLLYYTRTKQKTADFRLSESQHLYSVSSSQNEEKVAQLSQAKRHQEIKTPKEADMIIWGTDMLTKFIKDTWADNTILTLRDLQWKTFSLLCLATMAWPRSDIGRLQFQDIHFKTEEGQAISVIIYFPEAKETNMESTQLGLIKDRELCTTTTLYFFI